MTQSRIFAGRCETYELGAVRQVVAEAFEAFGGISALVKPGERVLLKPNMLAGATAEEATTTHPSVVAAVIEQVQTVGAVPFIADSPAFGTARQVAARCGLLEVAQTYNVPVLEFNHPAVTRAPGTNRRLVLDAHALEADKIINLAKLKSHSQLLMTGPVKNLFGCVNGKRKPVWHFRLGDAEAGRDFASMLLDVYQRLNPVFNLIDGIVAMEGNGPRKGQPRPMRVVLAGPDALALERAIASLVQLPVDTPVLQMAARRKIGATNLENIEVVGRPLAEFVVEDFLLPDREPIFFSPTRLVKSYIKGILAKRAA
jgi:uncharacterized protein (DUF362 family)